jgi:hypothetical protein
VSENPLKHLHAAGVSIWLDTLSRELLDSAEFATLIRDYAVMPVSIVRFTSPRIGGLADALTLQRGPRELTHRTQVVQGLLLPPVPSLASSALAARLRHRLQECGTSR